MRIAFLPVVLLGKMLFVDNSAGRTVVCMSHEHFAHMVVLNDKCIILHAQALKLLHQLDCQNTSQLSEFTSGPGRIGGSSTGGGTSDSNGDPGLKMSLGTRGS